MQTEIIRPAKEDRGEAFRPVAFSVAFSHNPLLRHSLADTATVLRAKYLTDKGWRLRAHSASLTFWFFKNRHFVVKVLIDFDNQLARRAGIVIQSNPIVVGIELTYINAFVRNAVRDSMEAEFGEYYLDPRKSKKGALDIIQNDKYWITPHNDHFYDIVFIDSQSSLIRATGQEMGNFKKRILALVG